MDVSRARLGRLIGASLQTEIVFLCIFGIISTMFDASLIDFSGSLVKVWEVRMDPRRFSEKVELYMKYVLTGIVLIRTFTAHIYLGCYILLLYPVLFEERPFLMLPWVIVNSVKCLLTGFMSLAAGVFTCAAYNFSKSTCWEFLLAQFIEHAPSVYMFCLVISYFRNLNAVLQVTQEIDPLELQARRRRTRLMIETNATDTSLDNPVDKRDELISVSTIENVIQHFNIQQNRVNSRSLDTLLTQMKDDAEQEAILGDPKKDETDEDEKTKGTGSSKMLLLTKSPQISKNILHKLQPYYDNPSNSKLLLNNWRSSRSVLSSMLRFSGGYSKTIFSNPLFEQYACNVSINAVVPMTSLTSMLRPLQSKYLSFERAKRRIVADSKSIPSEAEVRNVFPGEEIGKATVLGENVRRAELEVQTSGVDQLSWVYKGEPNNANGPLSGQRKRKQQKELVNRHTAKELPVLTEYYKNKASYSSGYRDDGYTQEFYNKLINEIDKNIDTDDSEQKIK